MSRGARRPLATRASVWAVALTLGWGIFAPTPPAYAEPTEVLICDGLKANWPSSAPTPAATCDSSTTPARLTVVGDATIGMDDWTTVAATPIVVDSTASPRVTLDAISLSTTGSPLSLAGSGNATLIVTGDNHLASMDEAALLQTGQGTLTITSGDGPDASLSLSAGANYPGIEASTRNLITSNSPLRLTILGSPAITKPLNATTDLANSTIVWWTTAEHESPQFARQSTQLADISTGYLAVEVPVASHAIKVDLAGGAWPVETPFPTSVMRYAGDVIIEAVPTREGAVFAGWRSDLVPTADPAWKIVIPDSTTRDVHVTAHWYTAPGQVRSLRLAPADRELALSWKSPASNGGSPIVGYRIAYSLDGKTWSAVSHRGTATSTRITGLGNGASYRVRVSAVNRAGLLGEPREATAVPSPASAPEGTPEVPPETGPKTTPGGILLPQAEYAATDPEPSPEPDPQEDVTKPQTQGLDPNQASVVTIMTFAILAAGAIAITWQSGERSD